MAENVTEVLAGAGVLLVAAGFAAWAGLGADIAAAPGSYELTASFRSVDGVNVGTDVRLAGVKVGTVTSLMLNPQTYYADATFTVKDGIEVPDDSTALVSSEGLLGGNFLEIQPGGSPVTLAPGEEILDTQGAFGLIQLMMKFVGEGSGSGTDGSADGGEPAPADGTVTP
jgi:phospholipid/cholesterol/gamma-HCH transport system substrate-binding protein